MLYNFQELGINIRIKQHFFHSCLTLKRSSRSKLTLFQIGFTVWLIFHVASFSKFSSFVFTTKRYITIKFFAQNLLRILQLVSVPTKTEVSKTTQIEIC